MDNRTIYRNRSISSLSAYYCWIAKYEKQVPLTLHKMIDLQLKKYKKPIWIIRWKYYSKMEDLSCTLQNLLYILHWTSGRINLNKCNSIFFLPIKMGNFDCILTIVLLADTIAYSRAVSPTLTTSCLGIMWSPGLWCEDHLQQVVTEYVTRGGWPSPPMSILGQTCYIMFVRKLGMGKSFNVTA